MHCDFGKSHGSVASAWPQPFFICHWTPKAESTAPFMSALMPVPYTLPLDQPGPVEAGAGP